jgi:hypothetical protein
MELNSSQDDRSMEPFLLAADNGYWEELESIVEGYDNTEITDDDPNANHNPFDVQTGDTKENVLHLLLKRRFIMV